jgi:hypothetical protein
MDISWIIVIVSLDIDISVFVCIYECIYILEDKHLKLRLNYLRFELISPITQTINLNHY